MFGSKRNFLDLAASFLPRLMPSCLPCLMHCCLSLFLLADLSCGVISNVQAAEPEIQIEETLLRQQAWIGDFEEMTESRRIRVLIVHSKTFYFLDRGKQRGIAYELVKKFEQFVNEKLKTKTLKVQVVFIPVRRDELITGLADGLGDIAVANLTITPERLKSVDFSDPLFTDVSEVLVSGPSAPSVETLDDLAGKEIHVRRSSSYYESLVRLNKAFNRAGKASIKLVAADEIFEDEDLLEMVNAGLIPMIVMDSHKVKLWEKVLDDIQVHPDVTVRNGGQIAWAFRKNSPQLAAVINEFVAGHKKGTLFGNIVFNRYLRNTTYIKNAVSEAELEKFDAMVKLFQKYADRYDFDYLMIGAQAYQESGLDHKKRVQPGLSV